MRRYPDASPNRRSDASSSRRSDASPNRHPDESQDRRFLTITQIPDQVRNDGMAVVILMLSLTVILTKVRIYLFFLKLKMEKQAVVYIMGNDRPTLYIGVTADFYHRISQHKEELVEGFTKKYHLSKLLYFEVFDNIEEAIKREKQLKSWRREWKLELIRKSNPEFRDLWPELFP